MEEKLTAKDILGVFKKYSIMIGLFGVVAAIIAATISYYFLDPLYEGTAKILVSETYKEQRLDERNIQADLQLVNTYTGIIESPIILERVIEKLQLNLSVDELNQQISVATNTGSQLIDISAVDKSQEQAVNIANTTANVFQEEVKNIMNLNNVQILSSAMVKEDSAAVSGNPLFNIAVGATVGLMLGIGLAFLLAYFDTSIKNEQDVEHYLGLPVLTVISRVKESPSSVDVEEIVLKEKEA